MGKKEIMRAIESLLEALWEDGYGVGQIDQQIDDGREIKEAYDKGVDAGKEACNKRYKK